MKARTLLLALPLSLVLTACGGGSSNDAGSSPTPSVTPVPTATASEATCTPSGKGTTDLRVKPVVPAHTGPAPAETMTYDLVCGTGAPAKNGEWVEMKYLGVLYSDGSEFDSTWKTSSTYTFRFQIGGGVIPGFSTGATGMRVGGRREVVIPAKDGYGDSGAGPIPPGAALIFVLDLVKIG